MELNDQMIGSKTYPMQGWSWDLAEAGRGLEKIGSKTVGGLRTQGAGEELVSNGVVLAFQTLGSS